MGRRIKVVAAVSRPRVVASRMVRDYVEGMYEPTAERSDRMSKAKHSRARAFAAWKQRVVTNWPAVRVVEVDADASPAMADLGSTRKVSVVVALGELDAEDVAVQLLHGQVGPNDELINTALVALEHVRRGRGRPPLRKRLRVRTGRSLRHRRAGRPRPSRSGHLRRDGLRGLGLAEGVRSAADEAGLPGPSARNDATPI